MASFTYLDEEKPDAGFTYIDDALPKPKQNTGIAGDIGTAIKRGVLQIPGMATGLADIAAAPVSIATGINRPVSRAADWIGEQTGFRPGKWAEAMRTPSIRRPCSRHSRMSSRPKASSRHSAPLRKTRGWLHRLLPSLCRQRSLAGFSRAAQWVLSLAPRN
jgi:hypothetical protein